MKILLAVFISLFSLNVSAQFFSKLPWKKNREKVPQLIKPVFAIKNKSDLNFSTSFNSFNQNLGRSYYSVTAEEAMIMKNLRHSSRYGMNALRIQFDNLAAFYFGLNRFSEAKWYLLRSNAISRQYKDYPQIINSLVVLADIKSNLGDFKQADEDLLEARNIAALHSLSTNLVLIEQHTRQIQLNKTVGWKPENHYAEFL